MVGDTNDDQHEEEESKLPQQDMPAPEISHHALSRKINPQTIRYTGYLYTTPKQVLIDSGNIHNIVQESIAQELSLVFNFMPSIKVHIGIKDSLLCQSKCLQVF